MTLNQTGKLVMILVKTEFRVKKSTVYIVLGENYTSYSLTFTVQQLCVH